MIDRFPRGVTADEFYRWSQQQRAKSSAWLDKHLKESWDRYLEDTDKCGYSSWRVDRYLADQSFLLQENLSDSKRMLDHWMLLSRMEHFHAQ